MPILMMLSISFFFIDDDDYASNFLTMKEKL